MPDHGVPGGELGNWLAIFGVIILIYVGYRIIAAIATRGQGDAAAAPPAVAPAAAPAAAMPAGIPREHIVVIAAAVQAMLGAHRIVHIGRAGEGTAWATEGRWAQQTSHLVRR